VVDGGDLIISLLHQIAIRQNVATVVAKKCVRVSIARAGGVVELRGIVHRLRVDVAIEVD